MHHVETAQQTFVNIKYNAFFHSLQIMSQQKQLKVQMNLKECIKKRLDIVWNISI